MKRLLTAGIFGTILGIVGAGTANASIVSSGFLDEKLTEYALSTSLDLKANQRDLTALNDIVGKETWDDFLNLKLGDFPNYSELFFTDNDPNKGLGIDNLSQSTLINFTITGFPTLAGVTDKFLHGWTNSGKLSRQGLIALNDGWTDKNDGTTYLGVKDLNTKIGSYYWGPENEEYKFSNIPYFEELFPTGISPDKSIAMSDMATTILSNYTDPVFPGLAGVTHRLLNGWTNSDGETYLGLKDINTKIGDLPSGSLLGLSPDSDQIYKIADGTDTPVYPANVAEMIQQLYGARQAGHRGIIPVIGRSISDLSQSITTRIGTLPDGKTVTDMISETETKIGTVPDGKNLAGMISETDAKIGSWDAGYIADGTNNPLFKVWAKYLPQFTNMFQEIYLSRPTSLADLIEKLYGIRVDNSGDWGILGNIGALIDTVGLTTDAIRSKIGTVPDGKNLAGMIGTLPAGYDSVGAALTAIKGIAEDAKAAALAAIPDPKQEGSSGKFVLTVDIVGDNATYRWEKIDREGETATE